MLKRLTQLKVVIPAVIVGVALIVVAMIAFQPWRLFTNVAIDEAPPGVTPAPAVTSAAGTELAPDSSVTEKQTAASAETPSAAAPVVLTMGTFISHEHKTSGSVRILKLADGSRVLRIEGLDTSNGPDLKVWLTDAPVVDGAEGWFVFDDGDYADLGPLKGNQGNQNYPIPADTDLSDLTSVTIWCDRFSVSFGAAELTDA